VKLIDFGTARVTTAAAIPWQAWCREARLRRAGSGAPAGRRRRIDVYAIGVMLWSCAPATASHREAQKHLEDVAHGKFDIPLLAQSRGIPKELDVIIQKLCANDPDERLRERVAGSTISRASSRKRRRQRR